MSTITVEVDLDEVFCEISDKSLLAEIARRKMALPTSQLDSVRTAIAQIRSGDTLDAITTLEREFWPKWASVEDSAAAFRKAAMGDLLATNDNQEAAGVPAVA